MIRLSYSCAVFSAISIWVIAAPAHGETLLERGTYLMNGIVACGNCHTPQTPEGPVPNQELAGQMIVDEEAMTAWAPNITSDAETGTGNWTDQELMTAIREGTRPDGSLIGPPMPFESYRHMSDRDTKAIIAYLRQVPAVSNTVPQSEYRIPLPPSYGPPVETVDDVSPDDPVPYGEYLVTIGHCLECHTPAGPDGLLDFENQLGAGGFPFHGPWGTSVSRNITSSSDGIAARSDDDLVKMITTGIRPDGSRMMPPMGYHYYANISSDDLAAIIGYLRTLPPKPNPE